jgi:hypothetical protein
MISERTVGLEIRCETAKSQHGIDMTLIERAEESETIGDDGYRRIRADIVLGACGPDKSSSLTGSRRATASASARCGRS